MAIELPFGLQQAEGDVDGDRVNLNAFNPANLAEGVNVPGNRGPLARNLVGINGVERGDEEDNIGAIERLNREKRDAAATPTVSAGGEGAGGGAGNVQGALKDIETPPPRSASRMGVGPGGPVMNFNEAFAMLNAPSNIGDVQGAISGARQAGESELATFAGQVGDPITHGARERDIINTALQPYAASQEGEKQEAYDAARDVIQRSYGGPRHAGEEFQQAQEVVEDARTAAEAMGRGRGRAAVHQLRGLTSGQARAETARQFADPNYARGVRQTGAKAADVGATMGRQFEQTAQTGRERIQQARAAGSKARAETSAQGQTILERAGARATDKNLATANAAEAWDDFVTYGDEEGIGEHINIGVLNGNMSRRDARRAWDAVWTRPEYNDIADYGPMKLLRDQSGALVLNWSNQAHDAMTAKIEEARQRIPQDLLINAANPDEGYRIDGTDANTDAWREYIDSPDFYAPLFLDRLTVDQIRGGNETLGHPGEGGVWLHRLWSTMSGVLQRAGSADSRDSLGAPVSTSSPPWVPPSYSEKPCQ